MRSPLRVLARAARSSSTARPVPSLQHHRILCFENGLESREILAIGSTHRRNHQGCKELGESSRSASVANGHACPACRRVFPCVGGFHWKRAFCGAHHKSSVGDHLRDLVRIAQFTTEEPSDECDLGTLRRRLRRLPLDHFDVLVPPGGVVRVRGIGGYLVSRSADLDLGEHIYTHDNHLKSNRVRPAAASLLARRGGSRRRYP